MAADYDWHPHSMKSGGSVFKVETRNLGWWVTLAVIVSVIIHIILYFILVEWKNPAKPAESEIVFRTTRDQVSIDRAKLEEILSEEVKPQDLDTPDPDKLSDLEMTQEIDEFELMEALKDEPIRMAPVNAPEVFAAELPQVPKAALDMEADSMNLATAEMLSEDLQEMRNKLVTASNQVAAEQVVLEVEADTINKGVNTDEFFKDAAKKAMGSEADEFVKGYATLDELISMTGGIKRGFNKTALLPSDILFGFNETELQDGAEIAMYKLAYLVETNPNANFIIEGHTDGIGGDDYNRNLSLKRAEAVREWLVRKLRIDQANIQVVGKGKDEPIVDVNGTREEQALNRRVEIVIRRD